MKFTTNVTKLLFSICSILLICLTSCKHLLSQNVHSILEIKVDSLVEDAIAMEAFPGAQVLILHKGQALLSKAYGYHTYDKQIKVEPHHLYDLASVTKIMAGGLALMKLQEEGKFNPDLTLSETHPYFVKSDKGSIEWRSILAHQARLEPYIVFWQKMKRKNGKYKWRTFKNKKNKNYNLEINDEIFLHKRYPKLMYKAIKKSPLKPESNYLYSGLCFLLIPDLVKHNSAHALDQYLEKNYFKPMGLDRIGFKPSLRFPSTEIVPTEIDTFFRYKLVHGYVHDENASMLSGISANAGLFANASDLGDIAQMLLDRGNYQNQQILSSNVIREYTSVQFPENDNRRGLTFDKPPLDKEDNGWYMSKSASPSSYGHSGFTGTFMWIDPEYELIVIFLSNRVYPSRSQRTLYSINFRPKLHQLAYDYILQDNH